MRFIPIEKLKGNEILAISIPGPNMQTLVRKGTQLTERLVKRILQSGVYSVYIEDETVKDFLEEDLVDIIDPLLRQASIHQFKSSVQEFDKRIHDQKKNLKFGDTGQDLFDSIKNISGDLIEEILTAKNTKIAMNDIKSSSDYHYEHSVNVAVLSLIIGTEIGLTTRELEALAFGALLIDVGCNWLDDNILNKAGIYSEAEMNHIKDHVSFGYDHINDNTTFNAHVKSIIMHHHERINGSGYPKGLTGEDIHPLAKIVMLADVYDAMTSDRPHRLAHKQHEAFEYIMAQAGEIFDFDLTNVFSRKIVPYPVGTYVQLSNMEQGIVIKNNPDHPLRPVVRIIGQTADASMKNASLNLLEHNNIVIETIVY